MEKESDFRVKSRESVMKGNLKENSRLGTLECGRATALDIFPE
jgi:hypothetical protein